MPSGRNCRGSASAQAVTSCWSFHSARGRISSSTGSTSCPGAPVLAYIERYLKDQKPQHLEAVLALGVPAQVSAEPLLHLTQRGAVLKLLRERRAQLIASDTHDPHSRPPNLGDALVVVRRRLGDGKADSLAARSGEILTHPPETNIRSI